MSFGWSAGDIAAAVKLLYDVYQTLDSVDGAAGEYREAVAFLKSLAQTLEPLKTFTDWDAYPTYGDYIKREVDLIKHPIEEFMESIRKFEPTLGDTRKKSRFRHVVPKIQWHISCNKRVLKLKSTIESHMRILDTLVHRLILDAVIKTQKTLPDIWRSVFDETIRPEIVGILTEALPHRNTLVGSRINDHDSRLDQDVRFYLRELKQAIGDSQQVQSELHGRLCEASRSKSPIPEANYQSQRRSLMSSKSRRERFDDSDDNSESLQELYYLVMLYLGCFLRDLFLLLSRLVSPQKQLATNLIAKYHITFLDAMGSAPRVLQYDAFRSFETLQAFIKGEFGHLHLIANKSYRILNQANQILDQDNWHSGVSPGSKVIMTAVLHILQRKPGSRSVKICPETACQGAKLMTTDVGFLQCPKCTRSFFSSVTAAETLEPRSKSTHDSSKRQLVNSFGPTTPPLLGGHDLAGALSRTSSQLPIQRSQESPFPSDADIYTEIESLPAEEDGERSLFKRISLESYSIWAAMSRIQWTSEYHAFDVKYIQEKFPGLPIEISTTLGAANTLRRRVFRYWAQLPERPPGNTTSLETVCPHGHEHLVVERTEVDTPSGSASERPSSWAPENVSGPLLQQGSPERSAPLTRASPLDPQSFLNVFAPETRASLNLWTPSQDQRSKFLRFLKPHSSCTWCMRCRLCLNFLSTANDPSPAGLFKHFEHDLRPFICFHEDCQDAIVFFNSLTEWFAHILNIHGGKFYGQNPPDYVCPICFLSKRQQEVWPRGNRREVHSKNVPRWIIKHVANHLRDVAMFSLTGVGNDNSDSEASSISSLSSSLG